VTSLLWAKREVIWRGGRVPIRCPTTTKHKKTQAVKPTGPRKIGGHRNGPKETIKELGKKSEIRFHSL